MTQRTVLVTGATGNQGGATARHLLKRGHTVRAFTRHPEANAARTLAAQGAELVQGDFDDAASLRAAADGVDAVFAMGTPLEAGPEVEERQALAVIDASVAAGVPHIVYTSAAAADRGIGISWFDSKHRVEKAVAKLDTRWTILAPAVFMDVVKQSHSLAALRNGMLVMALPPDRPLQYVDFDDIGAFAAKAIENPEAFHGWRFELASDELTGPELARILSDASGRSIAYSEVSVEQLASYGGEELGKMFDWFTKVGFGIDIARLHADHPEIPWHSFAAWAGAQSWDVLDEQPEGDGWSA
nr:NmrA family protein [Actinoallomurus sp.]